MYCFQRFVIPISKNHEGVKNYILYWSLEAHSYVTCMYVWWTNKTNGKLLKYLRLLLVLQIWERRREKQVVWREKQVAVFSFLVKMCKEFSAVAVYRLYSSQNGFLHVSRLKKNCDMVNISCVLLTVYHKRSLKKKKSKSIKKSSGSSWYIDSIFNVKKTWPP